MLPNSSRSLGLSLVMHAAAFVALMNAPTIRIPEREKSEYKLAIEGKEQKLIWYKFDKLPDVSPPVATAQPQPLKAENKARQQIVASPKKAPKRTQVVWSPAPELPDAPPVESPNLLAIKMPARPFIAPPDVAKPRTPDLQPLPDAPAIATPLSALKIADAPKMVKRFVAPPTQVPAKLKDIAVPTDAPQLTASVNAPATLNYRMKAPARPPANVEAPPSLANDLNVAVVGLNPSINPAPLPVASSPAQFSAAPELRKEGADSAADGKGLTVPDLFVRGGDRDIKSELRAQANAAPTSSATAREAMRLARNAGAIPVDPSPAPRTGPLKVSGAPDPRFNGRDVYMMAIQMPNLTSYSGSWLMWYADRTAREVGLAPVAPPVAHRKVDPKYIAAAVGRSHRRQGAARLRHRQGRPCDHSRDREGH